MININNYIKILPCLKLDAQGDIIRISVLSRLFLIILQFLSNSLIQDHDAGVFLYPKSNLTVTLIDDATTYFLNGFIRWDAQYFMHIAKYGYTYENTVAFFPMYPVTIRMLTSFCTPFLPLFNEDSILIIMFVAFNLFTFVCASMALHDLSTEILGKDLAYKATILFCFNPASVFFSAPYTECLFSYFTFKCMWHLHHSNHSDKKLNFKNIVIGVFYISLTMCTRSNGVLNVGFLMYYYLKATYKFVYYRKRILYMQLLKYLILLLYFTVLCFIPFVLIQCYNYFMFCEDFEYELPQFVINYAKKFDYILPGRHSQYNQTWCYEKIPLSYSHVQKHYWNVGFLNYYEFKQIPNFLLASPIIFIVLTSSVQFFKEHANYCMNVGILNVFKETSSKSTRFNKEIFVFVVHAFLLTIFCALCIHVQVTTRMICCSSPILYWFCAYYFRNYNCKQKIFFLDSSVTNYQRFIKYYFVGYYIVGTFMFCNFLPWT